jgi:hypothetical protein
MKRRASIVAVIAFSLMIAGIVAAQDDLNPDAKQVAAVRREHLAELMKIPHVVGVATELTDDGDVVLDLEVDKAENVTDVERRAPSEVDGFPVDVDVVEHAEAGPYIATFSSSGSPDNSH